MTDVLLGSGQGPQTKATPTRSRWFGLLVGLVLIELFGAYVLLGSSDWAFDDNIYLVLSRQVGFGWHWLSDPIFGHFAIGYRFAYSVLNHLMPIDYRWVLAPMLLLIGAAALTFFRILELLLARTGVALLATVWFAGSILFVRAIQWWAFGLQGITTVLADLLCLYGYLRYVRDGGRRWFVVSVGSLAGGLLFYEKAAFAPLYIALLRLLFCAPTLNWAAVIAIARRERFIWLGYVGVLAVWYAGYHISGANLGSASSPSAAQWARFFTVGWLQSVVPSAFGLGMPWANIYTSTVISSLQTVEVVLCQVAVLIAVIASLHRNRRAWRAWGCLTFLFALEGFLTGQTRITLYGPSAMGGDLRYWIDFAWLIPLLVCLAFQPVPRRADSLAPTRRASPRRAIALGLALLVYWFAAASSAHHMQVLWPGVQSRAWQTKLVSSLRRDRRRWPRAVMAQAVVPFFVIEGAVAPVNELSLVLPFYGGYAQIDGPMSPGPILTVDPTGAAVPATPRVIFRRTLPGCAQPGRTGRASELTIGPSRPAPGAAYLRLQYRTRSGVTLPLRVNGGAGLDASADQAVALSPHARQSIAWLGPNPVSRLSLTESGKVGVCVKSLDLITLLPG